MKFFSQDTHNQSLFTKLSNNFDHALAVSVVLNRKLYDYIHDDGRNE